MGLLAVNALGSANDWVGNSIMAGEGKEQHAWPVHRRTTDAAGNDVNLVRP